MDGQEPPFLRIRDVEFNPIVDNINLKSKEKGPITKPFLLLLGPSAVGKSEIMKSLISQGDYAYIKPYTTRPLREGETDKIAISPDEFKRLQERDELFAVNNLYEASYGAPKADVSRVLASKKIPILDYPLSRLANLGLPEEITTINAYCLPSNVDEWYQRLAAAGRNTWSRLSPGYRELWEVANTSEKVMPHIDFAVVNADGQSAQAARQIDTYVRSAVPWLAEKQTPHTPT